MNIQRNIAALDAAKESVVAASNAKDHFLATLSHELRTPLTPVLTTIETLELDGNLTKSQQSAVGIIRRNIELEARLIDDLLDFTRVTRGKVHLIQRHTEINALIANVLEICRKEIVSKRIDVRLDLIAGEIYTYADPARLQQVFWNIILNGVKFSPTGSVMTISTRSPRPDNLLVEFADNGIGIEPDHLETIFQPFEQGDSIITQQFGGLGLGLAISKMLVDLHGGTLIASSQGRDSGSVFQVSLNRIPAPSRSS